MHDTEGCRRKEQEQDRRFLNKRPSQMCDLIMKGGVTSGVVYPPAILKLSRKYRFHSIGGASAGAIAAAAAAAAEYGRQSEEKEGETHGFIGLAGMNDELRGKGFVRNLFRPSPTAAPLFNAFLIWTAKDEAMPGEPDARSQEGGLWERLLRLNRVCRKVFPGRYLLGLLVGLLLAGGLVGGTFAWAWERMASAGIGTRLLSGALALVALGVWGASGLLGGLIAGGWAFKNVVTGLNGKDEHKFGICPGSDGPAAPLDSGQGLALTDWLHVRLNALAGRGPREAPITVAELRSRDIHFKLVTSNLTLGQPYILPMRRGSRSFFFKRSDMARLFPTPVVDALVAWGKANRPTDSIRIRDEDAGEFLRFPMGEDIPLVVATRLSLSFPVLLSAVRLYSVKSGKYQKQNGVPQTIDLTRDIEEHWLSDGGITSNFPIHIFDTWVPKHPTFGITLYDSPLAKVLEQREGHQPEQSVHDAVLLPHPRDFDKARPQRTAIDDTLGFLRAIFETAQSYRDNAQAGMPSYRERILQLFLEENEGGLNLDMSEAVIERIQAKGRCAAQELLERYGSVESPHFSEHRWVRMHVLMAELERQLFEVRELFKGPTWKQDLQTRFAKLFKDQLGADEPWYRNKDEVWCKEAEARLGALLDFIEKWDQAQDAWSRPRFEAAKARAERAGRKPPEEKDFAFFFADYPPRPQGVLKVIPDL